MALTLARLLQLPQLKCINVLAGKRGLFREVNWTNTTETSEFIGFVHKNELVFTTGINIRNNEHELLMIVKSACKVGAAGIVINIGPYIHEVTPEIIEFGEQNSFPVLTIPWETRIADVSHTICEYIIKNSDKEHKTEDVEIYKLFAKLKGNEEVVNFYHSVLGKLEEYDSINKTGYMDFLRLYLENDASPSKVSRHLYMHRNTVLYKVKKIEEILGCDTSSTLCKTNLMVALIIKDCFG